MKRPLPFPDVDGIKKIIRCQICHKQLYVHNLNQKVCVKCGYRGKFK